MGNRTKTEQGETTPPTLVRHRDNRKSTFKLGRTIGAKRERLETVNERKAARKKDKRKSFARLAIVMGVFLALIAILIALFLSFIDDNDTEYIMNEETELVSPTIEIIDENDASDNQITSRMNLFVARIEKEFKSIGLHPMKAVIPKGAIREIDFYFEDLPGLIKTVVDRSPATTAEDAGRMIRYLAEKGIDNYSYIDVRIDKKAYWK